MSEIEFPSQWSMESTQSEETCFVSQIRPHQGVEATMIDEIQS